MYRTLELVLAGGLAVVFGLSALSRRFPDAAWLQLFRRAMPRLTEQQRAKVRRRVNIQAGVEMILMGLVLPLLYVAATVMFFHAFTATGTALVLVCSMVLIAAGATAVWRSRR